MSLMLILEAAGRSVVMGLIIWSALRLMRIRQIRAQRIAWLLALAGALLMPLLAHFQVGLEVLPTATVAAADADSLPLEGNSAVPLAGYLAVIYFGVGAVLLLRLAVGLVVALHIRHSAPSIGSSSDARLDVRVSGRISAPVTIRSSILLPINHGEWSKDRLCIVLSHESAHVRQRDFDVQLLAGLHCAVFWFSPFSWWLRRQLADLGEALSDHAGVQHADSRASYAEVLLSFAGGSAAPSAAVAMARSSNLSARIERLLSDGFHQYFASRPRTLLAAAGVAVLALAAATSASRVQAATHGFVHSDEMYAGDDVSASEPPPANPSGVEPSPIDIPPAPPAPRAPQISVPAVPPAPASHAQAIDTYAREMARAQRELVREAERLAHERSGVALELRQHHSEVGAELARAQQRMAAAQKELAMKMQSAEMRSLREQQSALARQMSQLAEQQVRLIERTMREFNAEIEKAVREELARPET